MSKKHFLEFEQPIAELETKIEELRYVQSESAVDISEEIDRLSKKSQQLTKEVYASVAPWQVYQIARHPQRPQTLDYCADVFTEFTELHGDRHYADDAAIVGGLARFNGQACMVIGHQRGSDAKERTLRNFGMPRPEGYRKAQRLMRLADRFGLPVVTLVDTPGAYPGLDAEARGQAEAIASSIDTCLAIGVPLVSVIIGEGGSGGALAIASADRVYMLENSVYSVITPEGCASILWRDSANAKDAAEAMKMTAADLKRLEVIDDVIPEPMGGAHRAPDETIDLVGRVVADVLGELAQLDRETLRKKREEKFLAMGQKGLQ